MSSTLCVVSLYKNNTYSQQPTRLKSFDCVIENRSALLAIFRPTFCRKFSILGFFATERSPVFFYAGTYIVCHRRRRCTAVQRVKYVEVCELKPVKIHFFGPTLRNERSQFQAKILPHNFHRALLRNSSDIWKLKNCLKFSFSLLKEEIS